MVSLKKILRAVNLGGDTKVSMSKLKELLADMGFSGCCDGFEQWKCFVFNRC